MRTVVRFAGFALYPNMLGKCHTVLVMKGLNDGI